MSVCLVGGCGRNSIARGLCTLHYQRAKSASELGNWARIEVPQACTVDGCSGQHEAKGLCTKHYQRFKHYGDVQRGKLPNKGTLRPDGYIDMNRPGLPTTRLHIIVAEKALGKKLPAGAVVHHVDENRSNNLPTNLVICPDRAYHNLIHQRMRAMAACGNPSWRKCQFCKSYDQPEKLKHVNASGSSFYHQACRRANRRSAYATNVRKEFT